MVESAAGLVEHVFPHVPVRQWVLSFPWPLRLLDALICRTWMYQCREAQCARAACSSPSN
jgi:hypothetical protein